MSEINYFDEELPKEITKAYTFMKTLPDGRICGVHRLIFHWTIHIGISIIGYSDRYCYTTEALAIEALKKWDGAGEPEYWHKHPYTGRRQ